MLWVPTCQQWHSFSVTLRSLAPRSFRLRLTQTFINKTITKYLGAFELILAKRVYRDKWSSKKYPTMTVVLLLLLVEVGLKPGSSYCQNHRESQRVNYYVSKWTNELKKRFKKVKFLSHFGRKGFVWHQKGPPSQVSDEGKTSSLPRCNKYFVISC